VSSALCHVEERLKNEVRKAMTEETKRVGNNAAERSVSDKGAKEMKVNKK
jgi:hypothetical protein